MNNFRNIGIKFTFSNNHVDIFINGFWLSIRKTKRRLIGIVNQLDTHPHVGHVSNPQTAKRSPFRRCLATEKEKAPCLFGIMQFACHMNPHPLLLDIDSQSQVASPQSQLSSAYTQVASPKVGQRSSLWFSSKAAS